MDVVTLEQILTKDLKGKVFESGIIKRIILYRRYAVRNDNFIKTSRSAVVKCV